MESSTKQKEDILDREFSNKWLLLVPTALVLWYLYQNWWIPRQECSSLVDYHPATQSVDTGNAFTSKQGEAEHYSFFGQKFKTKNSAVNNCMRYR